ncbi:MAG: exodeoxyribonuclease V subunit alpha [Desulfobacteraceae bacterium]|nr:exodeoxyribonuclease V subunit alpha [Desulfobacteraceae bacterium]MDH3573283.1 exodeoxyribonuclease V subunit alpha [Desulfobacteraceae bacterium]MDH3722400.1 exodeoxyribonuclease V subunit alpha [Desulfobacteraceae bacterium]MDH3835751.1 exodeoxyribonuclease V subunit alpha [Desulfobacteraceae bacterium]MDH3873934.1 exodeoxyribonuclease V subunit alpha [Desulfobacteraceae bacterium]
MNKTNITNLIDLSDIDVHFAKFVTSFDKSDNPDIFLAAAFVSRATGDGDGYLDLNSIARKPILLDINGEDRFKIPKLSEWLKTLSQSQVVGRPGEFCPMILDEKNRLYLYRYWDYENRLSSTIKSRIKEDIQGIDRSILKDSLIRLFPNNGTDEFNWHKVAGVIAAFKKFCVITGGPGTGKTFTTAKILALLLELSRKDKLSILIAAPTGKAAARIGESIKAAKKTLNCSDDIIDAIPSETYTIHRMLKTIPGSPYFYHNAENPLTADIVVVDEVSMVDLALMSKLLSAVKNDARIILIGDRDQLASVEAGFVMSDICDRDNVHLFSEYFYKQFEKLTRCKMEVPSKKLKDNPGLYDCMVVLKKSYRFTDTSGIGECSRAVNNGKFDETFSTFKSNPDQIDWKKISGPNDLSMALSKEVINGYSDYLNCHDPHRVLELFNRFRILCAVKFGALGVIEINRLTEEILNRNGFIELDNLSTYPWYRGRPVLITRNDYNLELFNGDIGITMPEPDSKSKDLYVYFSGVAGKPRRFFPHRLPEHETAYAMTVHKSQGSEFEMVLLILPNQDYPVLTRELLYTGITRAKNHISIWGREEIIKSTILRKINRNSGLKDALWEETD